MTVLKVMEGPTFIFDSDTPACMEVKNYAAYPPLNLSSGHDRYVILRKQAWYLGDLFKKVIRSFARWWEIAPIS